MGGDVKKEHKSRGRHDSGVKIGNRIAEKSRRVELKGKSQQSQKKGQEMEAQTVGKGHQRRHGI